MTSMLQDKLFPRAQLQSITEGVLATQPRNFSLIGAKFMGKTRILNHLASPNGPLLESDQAQRLGLDLAVIYFDCAWPKAHEDLLSFLADGVRRHFQQGNDHLSSELEDLRSIADGGERLRRFMVTLKRANVRPVLLLDNFDTLIEGAGGEMEQTINQLRPLTREMVLIVASERPLHEANRELASSPLFNLLNQLFLRLIEPQEVDEILREVTQNCANQDQMMATLAQWTGGHPFLISRIAEILLDVDEMLPGRDPIGQAHLPLIRLRLSEDYGHLLFGELWSALQNDQDSRTAGARDLVQRLIDDPMPLAQIQAEEGRSFFWLLNQGIVRIEQDTCHLFSPLFAEYVMRRLETQDGPTMRYSLDSHVPGHVNRAGLEEQVQQFTPQERNLFRYFLERPGELVTIDQLLQDVWKRPNASARRVQEGIRRLRNRLDTLQRPIGEIENEWGEGYRFIPVHKAGN